MAHVVQTVPASEADRVLDLMETSPDASLTPGLARDVAARLGASTIVVPRLDRLGRSWVFAVRVEDVEDGVLLAEGRGVEEAEEDVLVMVDQVIRRIRRQLGESRAVLAASEPLPQVLTPSLEALKKYRATLGSFSSQDHILESRQLLWEAVSLDTAFAMAWQRLSDVYLSFPKDADSSRYAADQVQRFRNRLTDARWADIQLHLRILDDVALWDVAFSEAEQAVRLVNGTILIGIRPNDDIWMSKRQIELREVRQMVERAKAENPEGSVVIIADKGSRIGTVTQVMDQVKLAGVEGIAISAEQPGGT